MSQYYVTDNLGVAAYLALNGMKYRCTETQENKGKKNVLMVFDDEAGLGHSLAQEFMKSREKTYRDFIFFFRREIDNELGITLRSTQWR